MTKNYKNVSGMILLLAVLMVGGCAVMLGGDVTDADVAKIHAGMPSAEVEKILGGPIEDKLVDPRTGSHRKRVYQYFLRDAQDPSAAWDDKVGDKFTGFARKEIWVFYDSSDRVIKLRQPVDQ